jgi:hypothetical protein
MSRFFGMVGGSPGCMDDRRFANYMSMVGQVV